MADIKSPRLLYLKGGLMLVVGLLASGLLIAEHPTVKVVFLLALAIWGFARAYYFAFYVIEHYIDVTEHTSTRGLSISSGSRSRKTIVSARQRRPSHAMPAIPIHDPEVDVDRCGCRGRLLVTRSGGSSRERHRISDGLSLLGTGP
jgi:hypothetical protein